MAHKLNDIANNVSDNVTADLAEAQIVSSYGAHGVIHTSDNKLVECRYRRQQGRPLCGDRVLVKIDSAANEASLEKILPRKSCFYRGDARLRKHAVAANLDQIVIVVCTQPEPPFHLLDRYLLAVENLSLNALLIFNKVDLKTDNPAVSQRLEQQLAYLQTLGYPVLETSCKAKQGLTELQRALKDQCSILVGQSGVGKSSLVNTIFPQRELQTRALSNATRKGRHTTTTTSLYFLPDGGQIIDSPGVWEFGLWKMPATEIEAGFIEFSRWNQNCRFANCLHSHEPGCAVKQAVADGQLPEPRYLAYTQALKLFSS